MKTQSPFTLYHNRAPLFALNFALMLTLGGCRGDDDGGTAGGDTGEPACPMCSSPEKVWPCVNGNGEAELICAEDHDDAVSQCAAGAGFYPTTCDNQGSSGSWSPGSYVSYSNGTYHIDETFFASLRANPNLLLLDSARLEWQSPYYQFEDVRAGDFAQLLGFADGDKLRYINSNPLDSMINIFDAAQNVANDREFYVVVIRPGVGNVSLHYVVD